MHDTLVLEADVPANRPYRIAAVLALVLAVASAHGWTPRGTEYLHVTHVALRKLYILPVLLAAIWFNLRGALATAVGITALFISHIVFQWRGEPGENINQAGELATIWLTAVLAGVLVGREKAALSELGTAYKGTVQALIAALDAREHGTQQHSERVRAYTVRLAEERGLAVEQRRSLALGALLHDIGKIGVPDVILLKPGCLSDDEWRQMRKHPELGQRILSAVPMPREAIDIVRAHHERYDGSGYPGGLAGNEIPLGARIFAVADVYDALTTTRPYRRPASHVEARNQIEQGAGRQFDPHVVEAFRRIPATEWKRIRAQLESRAAGDL